MRILGLTGSIGSGKSHVSSCLASLGAAVVDGDRISRALTAPGGKALPRVREVFGPAVFFPDGTLNRRALGALVFSSEESRTQLNAVMQPMILEEIHAEILGAREAGTPVCVLDMPLLFEEHLDRLCDSVWCVYLPEPLQIQRIMERDGCSRDDAVSRIRSQMNAEEKAARSDVIIDTSGSLEETEAIVLPLYQHELELSRQKGDEPYAGASRPSPSV